MTPEELPGYDSYKLDTPPRFEDETRPDRGRDDCDCHAEYEAVRDALAEALYATNHLSGYSQKKERALHVLARLNSHDPPVVFSLYQEVE